MSLSLRELRAQHTSLLGRWTELTATRETQAQLLDSLQLQLAARGLAALSAGDHAAQAAASAAAAADTLKVCVCGLGLTSLHAGSSCVIGISCV